MTKFITATAIILGLATSATQAYPVELELERPPLMSMPYAADEEIAQEDGLCIMKIDDVLAEALGLPEDWRETGELGRSALACNDR